MAPSVFLLIAAALGLLLPSSAAAQALQDGGRKRADAVRVAAGSIRVDGRLNESVWRDVPALTDFVQSEPVEGAPPTDRMEVRFAYDDNALYVGARMYSSAPIQSPLGRRDEGDQAEHLIVWLDTYLDRRTSSTFGVTAAGVRLDRYYSQDDDWPATPGSIRCGRRAPRLIVPDGARSCGYRSRSYASPIWKSRSGG